MLTLEGFVKAMLERERIYLSVFPWHTNWKRDFFLNHGWGKGPEIKEEKEMHSVGLE